MDGSYEANWDCLSRLQLGIGSVEPSWDSPARLQMGKRYVAPSARKHYYKDWDDDEVESGAAVAAEGDLEDQN